MPRGRPRTLSTYEKVKAKKIREYLSEKNVTRFDAMNDSALLRTVRISDENVFVNLDYHDAVLDKIAQFTTAAKKV